MKMTRTLQISEEEFYTFLENELVSNCHKNDYGNISIKDIKKGLLYSIDQHDIYKKTTVTILDYIRNKTYRVKIQSMSDTITLSYDTEVTPDGLKIVFKQDIASFNEKKQIKIMKMFSEAVYYGRMSDALFDIQKKIHSTRTELES